MCGLSHVMSYPALLPASRIAAANLANGNVTCQILSAAGQISVSRPAKQGAKPKVYSGVLTADEDREETSWNSFFGNGVTPYHSNLALSMSLPEVTNILTRENQLSA